MGGSPHTPADISHLLIRALGCWHFAHCNDFMVVTSPGQKKEVMEANSKGPDVPDHVVTYSSFQGKESLQVVTDWPSVWLMLSCLRSVATGRL